LKDDHILNLQLLELEESLLMNEIITIDDINNKAEKKDVKDIVKNYFNVHF
jgi:hypothetical protein